MWKLLCALLLAVASASAAVAESSYHLCQGFWTGNVCVGQWKRVDRWEPYHDGDIYILDRQQQRPRDEK